MLAFGKKETGPICLIMIMDNSNHPKYVFDTRDVSDIVSGWGLPVSAGLSSVPLRPCDMNILQTALYTLQNAIENLKLTNRR